MADPIRSFRPAFNAFRDVVGSAMEKAKLKELDDAYHLDQNPDTQLRAGWGIMIDGGDQTARENCKDSIGRTLTVVITTEARAKSGDMDRQMDQELDLFDRMEEVLNAIRDESTLDQTVYKCVYASDSGRQEIFLENEPYYYVEIVFNIEYAVRRVAG